MPIRHGDVGYISVWTPDAERGGNVLRSRPRLGVTTRQTHQVTNTKQRIGLYSVPGQATLFCSYAVADLGRCTTGDRRQPAGTGRPTCEQFDFGIAAAMPRIRRTPASRCSSRRRVTPRPELNGSGPGELSYITYEVAGLERPSRRSTAALLFWTFEPGRIDDGWRRRGRPIRWPGVAGGSAAGGDGADVDCRRRRRRGGPGARGRRHDHRGAVAAGLQEKSAQCTDDQGTQLLPLGERSSR